jgi:dienelactone hydrolase
VHAVEDDAWSDLVEVEPLIAESGGPLLIYPGTGHLVADSSHPDYDPEIAEKMLEQTLEFLAAVDRLSRG